MAKIECCGHQCIDSMSCHCSGIQCPIRLVCTHCCDCESHEPRKCNRCGHEIESHYTAGTGPFCNETKQYFGGDYGQCGCSAPVKTEIN
jgi:hypothetical protein